ncbi:MAG TPA: DUF2191 domain-containing protein [Lentisphaeria bacterium]|nr:MAG: hypothetical protein A2X47_13480 [Lentisphaerae bacterium GWF2_38_69]HBM14956.1 DUF2191 domain-containing protein [Lentisphaeria bacterium]
MRTTLDLPEKLLEDAMKSSKCKTKTEVIKAALKNFIQQNRIKELKKFKGKIKIDIDLDSLRQR